MKTKFTTIAIAMSIIPLLSACLWIFGEKYTHIYKSIINNTDAEVLFLSHSSKAWLCYKNGRIRDSIVNNKRIDTLLILPNDTYKTYSYGYGGGPTAPDFKNILIDRNKYNYSDSLYGYRLNYCDSDSVEIFFNNQRRIVIVNDEKMGQFTALDKFWETNHWIESMCKQKKGICDCVFDYFITDEMYNQAEPIQ